MPKTKGITIKNDACQNGNMKKKIMFSGKTLGVVLLIALLLQYIPIPFIDTRGIGTIIILAIAIYLLLR